MRARPAKPPYRVPSMREVEATPANGLRVVSTFSGCGGSCLGYRMAGMRVVWANEMVPHAIATYRENHPGVALDERDVRTVPVDDVLRATGLEPGELDLLDGSPPCQSFSTAGKRRVTDARATLFWEYARLLEGLRPRAFVAENVAGMSRGVVKGIFLETLALLRSKGYVVEVRELDAQWLGVPQCRRRLFFVGLREDLAAGGRGPAFPDPLPWRYSIAEACPWLVGSDVHSKAGAGYAERAGGGMSFGADERPALTVTKGHGDATVIEHVKGRGTGKTRSVDRPSPSVQANGIDGSQKDQVLIREAPDALRVCASVERHLDHGGGWEQHAECVLSEPAPSITIASPGNDAVLPRMTGILAEDLVGPSTDGTALGREAAGLRPGEKSSRYLNLVRADEDEDEPSPCVTRTGGSSPGTAGVVLSRRKFSILELKRVCSFPDDFVLRGSYADRWARLGNSVPPLMAMAVASAIRDRMLA